MVRLSSGLYHISGNYIIKVYGKEVLDFRDNAIVVSIPFNRLDLDISVQDHLCNETSDLIERKILEFCATVRSTVEITDSLKIKGRKTASRYIRKLLEKVNLQ